MSETMRDVIKQQYDRSTISRKPKEEDQTTKREQTKKLQSDVDKFLEDGGKVDNLDSLESQWDNVNHKTRYNKHTRIYKPAGVGDQ